MWYESNASDSVFVAVVVAVDAIARGVPLLQELPSYPQGGPNKQNFFPWRGPAPTPRL